MKFKDLKIGSVFVFRFNDKEHGNVFCKINKTKCVLVCQTDNKINDVSEWLEYYDGDEDDETLVEEVRPYTENKNLNIVNRLTFKDLNCGDVFRYNVDELINDALICIKIENNKAVYLNSCVKGEYATKYIVGSTPVIKVNMEIKVKDINI